MIDLHYNDWIALYTTAKLAFWTSFLLILLCLPLALVIAQKNFFGKSALLAVFNLPLVLPPTVLGFYLLILFSPTGVLGSLVQKMGGQPLAFHFSGLLVGSMIYSLPFAFQPLFASFEQTGHRSVLLAYKLKARPIDAFFTVLLPQSRQAILTAFLLTFAHTVGEFGVVLMIGGNIPGQTQVLSTLLYGKVELLEYKKVHFFAGIAIAFSLSVLLLVANWQKRMGVNFSKKQPLWNS